MSRMVLYCEHPTGHNFSYFHPGSMIVRYPLHWKKLSFEILWQAAFPSERLGMGAFRIALESIFNQ
jgi:hypothetical protein